MTLAIIVLILSCLSIFNALQVKKLKAENKRLKDYMCKLGIAEQVVIRVCKARGEEE